MPARSVIPAVIATAPTPERQHFVHDSYPRQQQQQQRQNAGPSRTVTYGAVSSLESSPGSSKGKDSAETPRTGGYEDDEDRYDIESCDSGVESLVDMTWRHMSRRYLLVPVITLLFFASLVMLVTFAWPPNKKERREGQSYPHPFLPWPFLTGIFAACTVQTLRIPVWSIVSWFDLSPGWTTFLSTTLHSTLHELLRLSTLPIITPSPSSGFHSSYYLGLGFGLAEVTWGMVQGWEQMSLYEDVMTPERDDGSEESGKPEGLGLFNGAAGDHEDEEGEYNDGESSGTIHAMDDLMRQVEEEAELERKVEALERMRGRRDLEEVIGIPFPNIPFPFHLLWRLDTLLLNLGLTLILSAYYLDPTPIYRHHSPAHMVRNPPATAPSREASHLLWVVWAVVVLLHVCISLAWKIVWRVGIGAVTWGGLIVALGTVFAGLGAWGGVV